jgi:hypothetical protein
MGYLFSLTGINVPIVFYLWRASKYPLFFSLFFWLILLWHDIFYLAHASLAWHLLFLFFLHSPYSLFEKHWREIYDMEFLFW